ncbi:MAG: chromate efflux transporter [Cyclobacteriaceae bacterium]
MVQSTQKPTFREAFSFWLKLGFISFGGPAGQIAIMHEFLVEKKKWISDSRFLHGLNYCMLLPGPEAQQLATYIGWLLHGVRGGLSAGLLFILPSVFILLSLSIAYVLFGKLAWVASLFYGLKPAVIAIVILALIKIGKKSLLSPFHYAVAIFSFISIFFFNVSFPLIILASILLGIAVQKLFPQFLRSSKESQVIDANESLYYLNRYSAPIMGGLTLKSVAKKTAVGLILWVIPVLLFFLMRSDFSFWFTVTTFFTNAALITFGGAYAVLPYVAQESVEKHHWLTQLEMIDGLALGETTPGPLIMVLVFVGFMAGYHHGGASIFDGTLGLLTTAYYTFLPCFLFIFIGAPLVETTKEHKKLKAILAIITAAVVGVILNLTIYFGKAVLLPDGHQGVDWFSLLWLIISFFALYKFKVNMIWWILVSAIAGLLYTVSYNHFF